MSLCLRLKVTRRIPAISMKLVGGKRAVDVERRVVTGQGEMESDERGKGVLKGRRRGGEGRGGGGGGRGGGGRGEGERGGGDRGEEGSRGMKQRGKGRRPSGGRGVRDGEDRGAEQERLQFSRTSEPNSS